MTPSRKQRKLVFASSLKCCVCDPTYAWNFAHPRRCEPLSDLPSKDGRGLTLEADDGGDDARGEEPRPAPSDGLGRHASGAPKAREDLADAPAGHLRVHG